MKGNCVDKFISNRLDKRINELLQARYKIRQRIKEREQLMDYFDSGCYEQDFSDIRKLKETSQKISDECSKFLERISEQYSKLN